MSEPIGDPRARSRPPGIIFLASIGNKVPSTNLSRRGIAMMSAFPLRGIQSRPSGNHPLVSLSPNAECARSGRANNDPIADVTDSITLRRMDDEDRTHLLDLYDANPASVEQFRSLHRRLIKHLELTLEEKEIMDWDANGRTPADHNRIAEKAWDFGEVGNAASRRRLFAGFVTNSDITNGYGADYLIDYALGAGIPAAAIYDAMKSLNGKSDQS